ncbi:MAG: hypothetical protein WCS69_09915 [Ignavibacteriaceae bacterium]
MKTKSLNQIKQYFLLAAYLFLVTAGSFHYHTYSLGNSGNTSISLQNKSNAVSDFLDNSEICSLDQFFQSITITNLFPLGINIKLPLVEESIVTILPCVQNKIFNLSYPLRAPPTI